MPSFFFPYTGLVTVAAVVMYFAFAWLVGQSRRKHKVAPPNVEGPEEFQRYMRVQANTTEQLLVFLPLLWLAALTNDEAIAASLGAVWVLGRLWYALGYYADSKKRTPGFLVNVLVSAILAVYAVVGLLRQIV